MDDAKPSESVAPPAAADRLGIAASTACAIHCAIVATIPSLGALGLGALMGHVAEWTFTIIAIGLAMVALWQGWRHHRSPAVAAVFALGVAALIGSRLAEEAGVGGVGGALGVTGAAALVAAHLLNIRAYRRRRSTDAP
ncbi:MAG: MerC domain-containing protein [Myxococcota bacterium]